MIWGYGCLNLTFQQYFSYILTFELPFLARSCKVDIHQGIYVPGHSTQRKESTQIHIDHKMFDMFTSRNVKKDQCTGKHLLWVKPFILRCHSMKITTWPYWLLLHNKIRNENLKKVMYVRVCVFVRHLLSFYPFYFDLHSARIIFDVSSGFYLWNINKTTAWHL